MKAMNLLRGFSEIDPRYLEAALQNASAGTAPVITQSSAANAAAIPPAESPVTPKRRIPWLRYAGWGGVAACIALTAGLFLFLRHPDDKPLTAESLQNDQIVEVTENTDETAATTTAEAVTSTVLSQISGSEAITASTASPSQGETGTTTLSTAAGNNTPAETTRTTAATSATAATNPQQPYITADTFGEAEPDFYIITGFCKWEGRLYQQFKHFELMPDGRYHVERALWDHTEDGFRYGDLFVPDGKVSMTRIYPEPDDPICAEVYFDCLASDAKLHRIGSCINVMKQKKLTVTDIDYDGSQHWSISLKDENGGEYYYGLSEYGTNGGNLLGVNVLDSAVGYGYTFAMYQGIPVIPLELVYMPADKIPVLNQQKREPQPYDASEMDDLFRALSGRYHYGEEIGNGEDFLYFAEYDGEDNFGYKLERGGETDMLSLFFFYEQAQYAYHMEIREMKIDAAGKLTVYTERDRLTCPGAENYGIFRRNLTLPGGRLPQITDITVITEDVADFSDIPQQLYITLTN